MSEPWYLRQLDKEGQAAYHAMKTGLAELRPAFPVPRLEGKALGVTRGRSGTTRGPWPPARTGCAARFWTRVRRKGNSMSTTLSVRTSAMTS